MAEAQLVRAITELSTEKQWGEKALVQVVKQFLMHTHLKKRTGKIVRALERYEEKQSGRVTVHVTSARPLSESLKGIIEKKTEKLFGPGKEKTKVKFHEDSELLGGVRLETMDTQYDFSLKRALNQLGKSLAQ